MAEPRLTVMAELAAALAEAEPGLVDRLVGLVEAAPRLFLHGTGRSGRILGLAAVRLVQLGLPVHLVGEAATPAAAAGDLLLLASGSGRTAATLVVAERGRALGLRVAVLTARADAPLAALADDRLLLPGTTKDGAGSAQPPGSLFEQALFCVLEELVLRLVQRRDPEFALVRRRHANLE